MTIDLLAQNENYAQFLPAIQEGYARYVVSDKEGAPSGLKPSDLNFLDGENPIWHYGKCLASAGILAYSDKQNAITQRAPITSWVLGDSGGFQIGTGKLKEIKKWGTKITDPEKIKDLWKSSYYINEMLRWVESNCDYAMTLDMPLWIGQEKYKNTPFYQLSDSDLLDITIDNLKYIDTYRGRFGDCKFLNVIQGLSDDVEDNWYEQVKKYKFEGWALGGSEGWKGGLTRVLRRILILRDDKQLGDGRDLLHVLGVSQSNWSVALTEIQRGVQRTANPKFTITYDSSTPFKNAEEYQRYIAPFSFNRDKSSWLRTIKSFPTTQASVKDRLDEPFCEGSPLSSILKMRDVCVEFGDFKNNVLSEFGRYALGNHNVFNLIDGFNQACKKANDEGKAPLEFIEMIGIIRDAFSEENWTSHLNKHTAFLEYISDYSKWKKD